MLIQRYALIPSLRQTARACVLSWRAATVDGTDIAQHRSITVVQVLVTILQKEVHHAARIYTVVAGDTTGGHCAVVRLPCSLAASIPLRHCRFS
jgi:hypothetical protein